ncbi:hypothetical protein ACROYT_G002895 [Oculina patagonica]
MMKSLFSLAFLLCISTAQGTICYQCLSNYGWDDCAAKQTVTDCPVGKDHCGVGILEVYNPDSGEYFIFYAKDCSSSSECWSFQTSRECNEVRDQNPGTIVSCQGFCCSGDNCNEANSPPAQTVQLKCYACQSSTGWDDCVSAQKEMTCALGNDRCGSVFVDVKSSAGSAATYAKGCLSHSECVGGVDCCSGNLCNSDIPETSIAPV